jgi:hypothetical protein
LKAGCVNAGFQWNKKISPPLGVSITASKEIENNG